MKCQPCVLLVCFVMVLGFWLSLPGAALVLSRTVTSQNLQAADWEKEDEELGVCENSRNESMSADL